MSFGPKYSRADTVGSPKDCFSFLRLEMILDRQMEPLPPGLTQDPPLLSSVLSTSLISHSSHAEFRAFFLCSSSLQMMRARAYLFYLYAPNCSPVTKRCYSFQRSHSLGGRQVEIHTVGAEKRIMN